MLDHRPCDEQERFLQSEGSPSLVTAGPGHLADHVGRYCPCYVLEGLRRMPLGLSPTYDYCFGACADVSPPYFAGLLGTLVCLLQTTNKSELLLKQELQTPPKETLVFDFYEQTNGILKSSRPLRP